VGFDHLAIRDVVHHPLEDEPELLDLWKLGLELGMQLQKVLQAPEDGPPLVGALLALNRVLRALGIKDSQRLLLWLVHTDGNIFEEIFLQETRCSENQTGEGKGREKKRLRSHLLRFGPWAITARFAAPSHFWWFARF